jgi:hypothetical protein
METWIIVITLLSFTLTLVGVLLTYKVAKKSDDKHQDVQTKLESIKESEPKTLLGKRIKQNIIENLSTSEKIHPTIRDLKQSLIVLKKDVVMLYLKKLGSSEKSTTELSVIYNFDIQSMMTCVNNNVKDRNIDPRKVVLNGNTIHKPVIELHKNDLDIFRVFVSCSVIEFLGRTVALTAWLTNTQSPTIDSFIKFRECVSRINWNNIDNWKAFGTPNDKVNSCIL